MKKSRGNKSKTSQNTSSNAKPSATSESVEDPVRIFEETAVRKRIDSSQMDDEFMIFAVPRYLSEAFERTLGNNKEAVVGYITGNRFELIKNDDQVIPTSYNLGNAHEEMSTTLVTTLRQKDDAKNPDNPVLEDFEIKGRVKSRTSLRCHPLDPKYVEMKHQRYMKKECDRKCVEYLRSSNEFTRTPASRPNLNTPDHRRKWCDRRERGEESQVRASLLDCFAKQRFYTLNELVKLTEQPHQFLRTILNDLCVYHTGETNRHKYELKPEFSLHHKK